MTKSEWRRKKMSRPRKSKSGNQELIISNKKEISFKNKFWKPKDKINSSS
jgi:hypothetical protein